MAIAIITGISLLCRFGFGITFGGSSETIDSSPDQHEETVASHDECLDNSVEEQSHNQTSYHYYTTIGSGIVVITLVLIIGGLVTYLKLRAKTNITLARVKMDNPDVQETTAMFKDPGPVHQDLQPRHNREVSSKFSPQKYPALPLDYKQDPPPHPPPPPSGPNPHSSQFPNIPPWLDMENEVQMRNIHQLQLFHLQGQYPYDSNPQFQL